MKLSLNGIKDAAAWKAAGISLPSYDVEKIAADTRKAPVWVHFGAGNIFRIFIGGLADKLLGQGDMDKGITCAETFDFDVIDKIYDPYDNLVLAVTLKADASTEKQVIGSLTEAIRAVSGDPAQWNRLKEIFVNPGLQMISFTITEKGYALTGPDGSFFPFIQADIENGPEKAGSAMAVVCALLLERYKAGKLPLAVVSMDNCSHNGEKLRESVTTVAGMWAQRGHVSQAFADWLRDESQVSFPWTMIDKITPRPAQAVEEALAAAGVEDMAPIVTGKGTYIAPFVNAERPQYLVVEDSFPNGRPPLEKAGVFLTDRATVNATERMKVTTCLNPLHTALAVFGCLLGYTSIAAEMGDKDLHKLVETIGYQEGLPVVTDPGILSPRDFIREVLEERLPNPFIPDTPQRIATDTSQKVGIRFGETIKSYGDRAGELTAIPLAIAGWLRYLLGVDDSGAPMECSSDPMLEQLRAQLAGIKPGQRSTAMVEALAPVLSNAALFGSDLCAAGLGEKIAQMLGTMLTVPGGVRATLKEYL